MSKLEQNYQNEKIVEKIKLLLKEKHKTYTELAKHLNITSGAVKKMFKSSDMSVSRLIAIADFFEMTLIELLENDIKSEKTYRFTKAEEMYFSKNLITLKILYKIFENKSNLEIQKELNISNIFFRDQVKRLFRLNLLLHGSQGRYRANIPHHTIYDENGPLGKATFQDFFKSYSKHILEEHKKEINNLQIENLEWHMTNLHYENFLHDIKSVITKHRDIMIYNKKFSAKSEIKKINALFILEKL